jgi:hypothetical protein
MKLQDPDRRIRESVRAIREWLVLDASLRIVLIDGSGYDWAPLVRQEFPSSQFECLSHENDREMVAKLGGGYGESQSLNYALAHSEILNNSTHFMKCTGKYWIANIERAKESDLWSDFKCKSIFDVLGWHLHYINTVFYAASVESFRKHFDNAYSLVNDHQGDDIEHVMGRLILKHKLRGFQLSFIPEIHGWSAHVDEPLAIDRSFRATVRAIKYRTLSYLL